MQPEWVSEWVRKIMQPLYTQKLSNFSTNKITQPLNKKNHENLPTKKNHENLPIKKNHAISPLNIAQIAKRCHENITLVVKLHFSKVLKKWEKKGWHDFLLRGCINFLTIVTSVNTVKNSFSVLLERPFWHIWQPMWCSQGSVLPFLWCRDSSDSI